MTQLKPSDKPVLEKISDLFDRKDRKNCRIAYEYLMSSPTSSYSHLVHLHEILQSGRSFNCFGFSFTVGIECVLWPNLYPMRNWCESTISGKKLDLAAKLHFLQKSFLKLLIIPYILTSFGGSMTVPFTKLPVVQLTPVHSQIVLLHEHLTQPFSPTYWQWQHRYLLDAVDQFGLRDAFITISPYEWSFPFAKWVTDIRQCTGKGPTQLAAYETYNITHTSEQLVRGYLCGTNTGKWMQHLFSYNKKLEQRNVKTYFYRFEFQQRGTVHLHMSG